MKHSRRNRRNIARNTARRTAPPEPVCQGTIAPAALGGVPCECFTFTTLADRTAFIAAMSENVGFVPQYATALDTEHDGPDRFLLAVPLPSSGIAAMVDNWSKHVDASSQVALGTFGFDEAGIPRPLNAVDLDTGIRN